MIEHTIAEAEAKMHRLASRFKVTEQGEAWLTAALDPCHDVPIVNLEGLPTGSGGNSVVRCIKMSTVISSPFGAGVNWDCHVFNMPFLTQQIFDRVNRTNSAATSLVAANLLAGGINYCSSVSGTPWSLIPSATQAANSQVIDARFTKGSTRFIGGGFEVINTTAPLYNQGTCTAYRLSNPMGEDYVGYNYTTPQGPYQAVPVRGPPADVASAMLLPGAKQWKAEQGSYSVITFNVDESQPQLVAYRMPVIHDDTGDDLEGGNVTLNTSQVYVPKLLTTTGFVYPTANRIFPLDISGVFFSGLHPSATLTITSVFYIESFPSKGEVEIVTLGSPSPALDMVALELYSEAVKKLPAAVPFCENPAGEWFWDVVDVLADVAPVIGGIIGGSPGMAIGGIAQQALKSQRPKKKKKKTAPKQVAVPPQQRPALPPPRKKVRQAVQARKGKKRGPRKRV
nr:hypothetical protein [Stellavirales sp.]